MTEAEVLIWVFQETGTPFWKTICLATGDRWDVETDPEQAIHRLVDQIRRNILINQDQGTLASYLQFKQWLVTTNAVVPPTYTDQQLNDWIGDELQHHHLTRLVLVTLEIPDLREELW